MTTSNQTSSTSLSNESTTHLPTFDLPTFGPWRSINRTAGLILLSLRRLRHYVGLNLLALIGVVVAVGLVTSAGFFSQAVDTVVMRQELAEYSRITGKPPFSVRVFNSSTPAVPLSLEWAAELGKGIGTTLSQELDLPVSEYWLADPRPVFSGRASGAPR